jgi:predicted pyridoxine 5'-phosphate oxidase superfamily flavin-nucleotide-binding protein
MALYHPGNRELQDKFDTRRLADRLDEVIVSESISESDAAFISSLDHFFLASVSPDGMPTVGYKGGAPGFVRVVDDRTLAFPNYNGNGMYLAMGNVVSGSMVGILFLDWTKGHRLRVHGSASLHFDDELMPDYPEAQFMVRVHTTSVFPNCPRYIHRMEPKETSTFVPQDGRRTPVPSWKRSDWAVDVLPNGDPALEPDAPVV